MPDTIVIGLIAGGETALRKAVEAAEDDPNKAWKELEIFNINTKDTVIGIAASGHHTHMSSEASRRHGKTVS
ncbi:MAG: hypothetical protein MZV63_33790 [Marinilabiliales bacterium]|nr:hypothetical protein [Marinilabiliales bacterium]